MEFKNKTDEELKQMSEDELFAYLDAKAAHLKQHTAPLSNWHVKRYSHIGEAVSKTDKGTDEVFSNGLYDSLKPIIEENESESFSRMEKIIKQRNK
jgi:hypothetical protein